MKPLCLWDGPINGYVVIGLIDKSNKAKVMPERDRRMMYEDGKYYRQFKHYKGMYCIGVSWEECDENGQLY